MNYQIKPKASIVPAYIIVDEQGRAINGPGYSQIFFRKAFVQTYSEELRDRKIRHTIKEVNVIDATGELNKDYLMSHEAPIHYDIEPTPQVKFRTLKSEINEIIEKYYPDEKIVN